MVRPEQTSHHFAGAGVLVTGAAAGIGLACVERLLRSDARVVALDCRPDALAALRPLAAPEQLVLVPGDVAEQASVEEAVVAGVRTFGGCAHLVHSAGSFAAGSIEQHELEALRALYRTHVEGAVVVSRAFLAALGARPGSITHVSSVSGSAGDYGLAFYNAAKGALANLTRSMALELAGRGVRVNAVSPCVTRTSMTAAVLEQPQVLEAFAQAIPLGRPAEPDEVAAAIVFLASDAARFITGAILPVDGGLSAWSGQPNVGALLAAAPRPPPSA